MPFKKKVATRARTCRSGGDFWREPHTEDFPAHRGGFDAKFYNATGLSEIVDRGVAMECQAERLTLRQDHYLAEIPTAHPQPVPLGEEGELVLTPYAGGHAPSCAIAP